MFGEKREGGDVSGLAPDTIMIPARPREMVDELRTFCEEIVNSQEGRRPVLRPGVRGNENPPAGPEGFLFEKREREEIVWSCT